VVRPVHEGQEKEPRSPQAGRGLAVVMYHFVRDLAASRYPDIKGLTVDEFVGQVGFMRRHFTPVGMRDVLDALREPSASLPPRAILLTFDDGYRDHCDIVLPVLLANGMSGCFFPPAKAVLEHEVLDVNKIHFILASEPDKQRILGSVFRMVDQARGEFDLRSRLEYERDLAHPGRFDPAEVILIKRLLQRDLPEPLRNRITDELFREYVSDDEAAFSRRLYMSVDDLRALRSAGMWIGSHAHDHYWLDSLDLAAQEREVDLSLEFLRRIGCDMQEWVIAYPYGAYSASLLRILRQRRCRAGFTTEVRKADLDRDDPLTLPRVDTNDLPRRADAEAGAWAAEEGQP
jgi:peptidoglycan/xylan/chitin deacetylase (PgdA/CDA1 family)